LDNLIIDFRWSCDWVVVHYEGSSGLEEYTKKEKCARRKRKGAACKRREEMFLSYKTKREHAGRYIGSFDKLGIYQGLGYACTSRPQNTEKDGGHCRLLYLSDQVGLIKSWVALGYSKCNNCMDQSLVMSLDMVQLDSSAISTENFIETFINSAMNERTCVFSGIILRKKMAMYSLHIAGCSNRNSG
jgi:hypothetical protein